MKKKGILMVTITLLVVIVVTIFISKNSQKYIMKDGVMLAMTLTDADGNVTNITSFPTEGDYHVDIECVGGNGKYQPLKEDTYEMKFIVEDITSTNVKCNIDFITISDANKENYLLTKEISNKLATSPTNSGICSNETYTTQSTCEAGEGHWYYVSSTKGSNDEDAGIRYSGKQPSNWIWFNNELWRIIGIIPTKLSDGTETSLVKIIRADSIGGLVFHSAASNTIWGGTGNDDANTLYTLLNTKYYGKDDATGASLCLGSTYALCNYKEIGISNSNTDYYGKMIKDVYWNVGTVSSTSTVITNAYTTEAGTKSTVTGRIALMNASDYGYATSGITYSSIRLASLKSYTQNNWLYGEGSKWTLTPYSTSNVVYVTYAGNVLGDFAIEGNAVRPVLYLDASVYVVSGEGTESNPYQIAM